VLGALEDPGLVANVFEQDVVFPRIGTARLQPEVAAGVWNAGPVARQRCQASRGCPTPTFADVLNRMGQVMSAGTKRTRRYTRLIHERWVARWCGHAVRSASDQDGRTSEASIGLTHGPKTGTPFAGRDDIGL
jgi:hypothetical protein